MMDKVTEILKDRLWPGHSQHEIEQISQEIRAAIAKELPNNWLDPILIGKDQEFDIPWECPEIEAYTKRLQERIKGK